MCPVPPMITTRIGDGFDPLTCFGAAGTPQHCTLGSFAIPLIASGRAAGPEDAIPVGDRSMEARTVQA
jgi:hypothetical protein